MDDINLYLLLFLIATGFIAAFIDTVVGGGGLISLPALLFTGMPPVTAIVRGDRPGADLFQRDYQIRQHLRDHGPAAAVYRRPAPGGGGGLAQPCDRHHG